MSAEKVVLNIVDKDIAEEFVKISEEKGDGHFSLILPLTMHIARHTKRIAKELEYVRRRYSLSDEDEYNFIEGFLCNDKPSNPFQSFFDK